MFVSVSVSGDSQTRQIGFLDEQNFHIDNDEHDMILRVHAAHGLKAARFAVGFYMPKQDSTTRKYHKMPPLGRRVCCCGARAQARAGG